MKETDMNNNIYNDYFENNRTDVQKLTREIMRIEGVKSLKRLSYDF